MDGFSPAASTTDPPAGSKSLMRRVKRGDEAEPEPPDIAAATAATAAPLDRGDSDDAAVAVDVRRLTDTAAAAAAVAPRAAEAEACRDTAAAGGAADVRTGLSSSKTPSNTAPSADVYTPGPCLRPPDQHPTYLHAQSNTSQNENSSLKRHCSSEFPHNAPRAVEVSERAKAVAQAATKFAAVLPNEQGRRGLRVGRCASHACPWGSCIPSMHANPVRLIVGPLANVFLASALPKHSPDTFLPANDNRG